MIIMVESKNKTERQACISYLTRYFKNRKHHMPITCEVISLEKMEHFTLDHRIQFEKLLFDEKKRYNVPSDMSLEEYMREYNLEDHFYPREYTDTLLELVDEMEENDGIACSDLQDKLTSTLIKMMNNLLQQYKVRPMAKDKVYILDNFFTTIFTPVNKNSFINSEISNEIDKILNCIKWSNYTSYNTLQGYAESVGYPLEPLELPDTVWFWDHAGEILRYHLNQDRVAFISQLLPVGKIVALCITECIGKQDDFKSAVYHYNDSKSYFDDIKYVCLKEYMWLLKPGDNSGKYYNFSYAKSGDASGIQKILDRAISDIEKNLEDFCSI